MAAIHQIRLRGPWEVSVIAAPPETTIGGPSHMNCPCTWREGGWPNFQGTALHVRRFGQPSQADIQERVWLVIDPCRSDLNISLNGKSLGSAGSGQAFKTDITEIMLARNELAVEVSANDDSGGLTGEVRLEIQLADEK